MDFPQLLINWTQILILPSTETHAPIILLNVKHCEGSEIIHLKANKLACYGFMAAGREHETSESEAKSSLLHKQQ